ncbi:MAG: threonine synthase [Saprospiraceae bacterium]
MNFYSTGDTTLRIPFEQAIFMGPAPDGGLFMPASIPSFDPLFFKTNLKYSIREIGFHVIRPFTDLPEKDLYNLIEKAFTFDSPLRKVGDKLQFLELFHGPTLAFKDFGARFMAQVMSYYRPVDQEINILVATSGDTGGAVASAFSGLEGFKVYILFPKGKVSPLQQRQLTTWDTNIQAIEVDGTFDDCQRLVKQAFSDQNLRSYKTFGSANSINIARLLPQMVYYFEAYKQAENKSNLNIIVPSGNFGNITAGLFAKKMGLPISFTAATNSNDIVPKYLLTSEYNPRVSRETLSNAMDVGDPSNFARMLDLYQGSDASSTWNNMKSDLKQHVVNDDQTLENIRNVWDKYGYLIDPHTAVAFDAAKEKPGNNIIVSTAHWAKFAGTIERAIGDVPEIPVVLMKLMEKEERYNSIGTNYKDLLSILN